MREWPAQRHICTEADAQRLYALCGTRLYCVESLAGTFPDLGWHQAGEMGGVWSPPIKLLDGYWIGLRRRGGTPMWLTRPLNWQLAPDGATLAYALPALGVRVWRRSWIVPDQPALVVDVTIESDGDAVPGGALECGVVLRSDLHGVWLSEQLGWTDGLDVASYRPELRAVVLADRDNAGWTICAGAASAPVSFELGPDVWGPEHTAGRGCGAALWYACTPDGATGAGLHFLITGSARATHPATALHAQLMPAAGTSASPQMPLADAHERAIGRFAAPFAHCVLRSPEPDLDEAFAWAKANTAWLALDVPGLGRAPMGGLPDYPWWFGCDTAYGALAMLPIGQAAEAGAALHTLAAISRRQSSTGAVVHEVVTNGIVTSPGNLVEVPLFVRALYYTYQWTGDRALLEELFPFCLEGMLGWALGRWLPAGEEVPQGRSMAETPEMHGSVQTLDVAAYTAEALDLLAELAVDLEAIGVDAPELAASLRARAMRIREHVRQDWWLPGEGFFGDMRASRSELEAMLARFEALAEPDPSQVLSIARLTEALAVDESRAPADACRPWLFLHYLQALAAEAGLPTADQAQQLLARMETPEWSKEHGVVLNAATDRRIMTLPTGALACAEARYGRADAALAHIRRITTTLGRAMPGAVAEFSPDGGCFLQLWSGYGIVWPIVRFLFGLRPDVARRRLVCIPLLPAEWPAAELRAIPLADAQADVCVAGTPMGRRVRVEVDDPAWVVEIGIFVPDDAAMPLTATLNGEQVSLLPMEGDPSEQRAAWLAPPASGAGAYELVVSWADPVADCAVVGAGSEPTSSAVMAMSRTARSRPGTE